MLFCCWWSLAAFGFLHYGYACACAKAVCARGNSGIEISIPMETYNKLANFEVQTDVTGKSTIIIRNIDNLVLK